MSRRINRANLDKALPRKTLWDFINSPFILFLFTSVMLSGVSFGYNEYISYKKKSDEAENSIKKLVTEIRYRTDVVSAMVQDEFTYTIMYSANGAFLGDFGNKSSDSVIIGNYSPIYQEYTNRNLISLLWELQDLQESASSKNEIHKCIDLVTKLRWIWDNRVERAKARIDGDSDSIWRFRTKEDLSEFKNYVALLRSIINKPLKTSRS